MNKIIKSLFVIAVVVFIGVGSSGAYLSDSEKSTGNQFTAGTWETVQSKVVINEVYYDTGVRQFKDNPNGKTEEEGKNEWIELYNPTAVSVGLSGWSITDNSGVAHSLNGNTTISSHSYVLLSHDNDTWKFWPATGAEKVNLGGSPGSGWLANAGDRVILRDNNGNIIDQMSYGADASVFNLLGVDEGYSLERKTPGLDTDTASDFVDKFIPTPGA